MGGEPVLQITKSDFGHLPFCCGGDHAGFTGALNGREIRLSKLLRKSVRSSGVFMKLFFSLIGVVLLVVAAVYFLVPADQLPTFLPGHEVGLARIRMKHGAVAGVVGIVCLVLPMVLRRR